MRCSGWQVLKEGLTGDRAWQPHWRKCDPKAQIDAATSAEAAVAWMPLFAKARVLRRWGGIMDRSPDGSSIINRTQIDGLYQNTGGCFGGFGAAAEPEPTLAHLMANDRPHASREKLRRDRFEASCGLMDDEGTSAQHNLH